MSLVSASAVLPAPVAPDADWDTLRAAALLAVQEEQARALEPFFSTRRASGASGLGLTLVNELLRQHGGSLSIAPTRGRGSTIEISLPAAPTRRAALMQHSQEPRQDENSLHVL